MDCKARPTRYSMNASARLVAIHISQPRDCNPRECCSASQTEDSLVVHHDGDHANIGQIPHRSAHDVLTVEPLLPMCV
eukprot:scaffold4280_cov385-Prasinococcus_capsulatus_cf.AAC.4